MKYFRHFRSLSCVEFKVREAFFEEPFLWEDDWIERREGGDIPKKIYSGKMLSQADEPKRNVIIRLHYDVRRHVQYPKIEEMAIKEFRTRISKAYWLWTLETVRDEEFPFHVVPSNVRFWMKLPKCFWDNPSRPVFITQARKDANDETWWFPLDGREGRMRACDFFTLVTVKQEAYRDERATTNQGEDEAGIISAEPKGVYDRRIREELTLDFLVEVKTPAGIQSSIGRWGWTKDVENVSTRSDNDDDDYK